MKTERKRIIRYFTMNVGGGEYKHYKIVDDQDLLEVVKDEQTGREKIQRINKERTEPLHAKEITSEEYHRMKEANTNGENQEG